MDKENSSRTAQYMALFRAVETAEPSGRRLFEDVLSVPLLSGKLKALAMLARMPLIGRAVTWFLDAGWPRTRSSGVLRTKAIDDFVRQSLQEGVGQFLLLGAGFDSRPYRISEAKGARTIEVDHPATQTLKRRRLCAHLGQLPRRVCFVLVDFEADDLAQSLFQAGFNKGERTIAVWEGVISYLSPTAVHETFLTLARLLAPASRLVFTYAHRGALDGSVTFPEAQRWKSSVRASGEPFIYGFEPDELAGYLREHEFVLMSDVSTADVGRKYNKQFHRSEKGSELYRVAVADRE